MKPIDSNTKLYQYSNSLHCKHCGETNKYFRITTWSKKNKKYKYVTKVCSHCHRDKQKEYSAKYRNSEKGTLTRRKYFALHKDKIYKNNREKGYMKNLRARKAYDSMIKQRSQIISILCDNNVDIEDGLNIANKLYKAGFRITVKGE